MQIEQAVLESPEDVVTEEVLIAALIDPGMDLRSKKLACTKLTQEMFASPYHAALFNVLKNLTYHEEKPSYDIDFILSRTPAKTLTLFGGKDQMRSRLFDIVAKTEFVSRLDPVVDMVLDTAKKREVHKLACKMIMSIKEGSKASDVLFMTEETTARIQSVGSDTEIKVASNAARSLNNGIPLLVGNRAKKLIYTGLPSIDDALLNLPGTLGVVAATPGGGKSTLMVQSAFESAKRGGVPLLISLEMDGPEIESRLMSRVTAIDNKMLLLHGLPKGTQIGGDNLAILDNIYYDCDLSGISWPALETRISQAVVKNGIDSVWIDYLTLMNPPELKGRNMAANYGEITKAAKRTAQKLGVAIVLVSQFNRLAASEGEPQLHHLRETGQLEQDATWCSFLWERDGSRWIKVAKNRSGGRTVKRKVMFDGSTQTIREFTDAA
jgi:replicative DNA helicase